MTHYVMVLNDGETYSSLDGCQILALPDNSDELDYVTENELVKDWKENRHLVAKVAGFGSEVVYYAGHKIGIKL